MRGRFLLLIALLTLSVPAIAQTASGLSYSIPDRGAFSATLGGHPDITTVSYLTLRTTNGSLAPAGTAIFGLRQNGVLVTEVGVPASPLIRSGRIPADISGPANTGLAIANPNAQAAQISFYVSDAEGRTASQGSITIPAAGQLSRFLDQAPFSLAAIAGATFTFTSTVPVSVAAFRGLTNERSEFLITSLPVADLSAATSTQTLIFPQVADGGGWTSQVMLINPTDQVLTGSVEFWSPGTATSAGAPLSLTSDRGRNASFQYTLNPRASWRLRTAGSTDPVIVGSVRIRPSSMSVAPAGLSIMSFRRDGTTVSEAGVAAINVGTTFRIFVETAGTFGHVGSIQTGFAIANPSSQPVEVLLELTDENGNPVSDNKRIRVPADGQLAVFLKDIPGFDSLPTPLQGVLRLTTNAATPIAVMTLRGRYNERGDFLVAALPTAGEGQASSGDIIFPHLPHGGGYSTQLILFGNNPGTTSTGVLTSFTPAGTVLDLLPRSRGNYTVDPTPSINRLLTQTDLSAFTGGSAIHIVRTYLLDSGFDSPIGFGWVHNFLVQLEFYPDRVIRVFNPDGTASHFKDQGGGVFTSEDDNRALTANADGYSLRTRSTLDTTYQFDRTGRLVLFTRGGQRFSLQYDALNHLREIAGSASWLVRFGYNAAGKIESVIEASGQRVAYGYDLSGNLTSVTHPDGPVTRYSYDGQHNLVSVFGPNGSTVEFRITPDDRLAGITDGTGTGGLSFTYNPTASLIRITDSEGRHTTLTYDQSGMVTSKEDPLGGRTAISYDSRHRIVSASAPDGSTVRFNYDPAGNLASTTDPLGRTTTYEYSLRDGNLVAWADPSANRTAMSYDPSGRLVRVTYADGSAESFVRDSSGRATGRSDATGATTRYEYAVGFLTRKFLPDSTEIRFERDAQGKATRITTAAGAFQMSYDSSHRVSTLTGANGGTVAYRYDVSGRRTHLIYPDGSSLQYEYDAAGRIARLTVNGVELVRYTYDSMNRLTRRIIPGAVISDYGHDAAGRVTSIAHASTANSLLSQMLYTYDMKANPLSYTRAGQTTRYEYDAANQLRRVVLPDGQTQSFVFDSSGNRTSVTVGSSATSYSTNRLNQYTRAGEVALAYDLNGALVSRSGSAGSYRYSYNSDGYLTRVDTPNGSVGYSYDPFGRLISRTSPQATTYLVYDGRDLIAEVDAGGAILATYFHGVESGEVIAILRGGAVYYPLQDALGSTVDLVDASARVIETYSYDPYGVPAQESAINPFLFAGRPWDRIARLYYNHARHYDPTLGRFLTRDPLRYGGEANLYTYADNNPAALVDPNGMASSKSKRKGRGGGGPTGSDIEDMVDVLEWWFDEFLPGMTDVLRIREGKIAWWYYDERQGEYTYEWLTQERFEDLWNEREGLHRFGNDYDYTWWDGDGNIHYGYNWERFSEFNDGGDSGGLPNTHAGDPSFVQFPAGSRRPRSDVASSGSLDAQLLYPPPGSLVRGEVPVFGLASGPHFKEYRVEIGDGENPADWTVIARSSQPITEEPTTSDLLRSPDSTVRGNLATWDTGLGSYVYLPSHPRNHPVDLKGIYTVRLVVRGTDGKEIEDRVIVTVADVIPNALGGDVISKDGRLTLSVPEQALNDAFRLISFAAADPAPDIPGVGKTRIGQTYSATEYGETFTKPATLRLAPRAEDVGNVDRDRLGLYGYDSESRQWKYIPSITTDGGTIVQARIRKLHAFYALVASDTPAERSAADADAGGKRQVPAPPAPAVTRSRYLVQNTFEDGVGQWSNRDGSAGGIVELDDTFDGTKALKVSRAAAGGNFAVNVLTTPFDARIYPVVQFDYRIQPGIKTNFLVKVAGRWYDVEFTDDPKALEYNRVNIAALGAIQDIVADDRWHTGRFNLYDMLRARTGTFIVDEMIMADWDVSGFMKLTFGTNPAGATYYIDNFTVSREGDAGAPFDEEVVPADSFNQQKTTNAFGERTSLFFDGDGGTTRTEFVPTSSPRGYALKLESDLSDSGTYGGYVSVLPGLDLRGYGLVSFRISDLQHAQSLLFGLKDRQGKESKVPVNRYAMPATDGWHSVEIPLPAFVDISDWSHIVNFSLILLKSAPAKHSVVADDIAFHKSMRSLRVDDFRERGRNLLGREHRTINIGTAQVSGEYTLEGSNNFFSLSYGGGIGRPASGSPIVGYAMWSTDLGGIDCSRCEALSFLIRGGKGGEKPNVYLDDGNHRWGLDIEEYAQVTTSWQRVTIPLRDFIEYGVDLTHLHQVQIAFEWEQMSGDIHIDDIQFGSIDSMKRQKQP